MTPFTPKGVQRLSQDAYNVLYGGKYRRVVVRLTYVNGEGDFLEFREQGTRARFLLPVEGGFRSAVRRKAAQDQIRKLRDSGKLAGTGNKKRSKRK